MAPKKRLLIDNPPSASSTSDDSSSNDANQYIQLPSKHPLVEVDSSSNEEVNSSSEDVQHSQPPSQNPPPSTPISNPPPSKKVESGVDNFILNEIFSFDKDFVKKGLESIEESKKAEIQGKYKQMQIAELEVFVNRAQLIKDQTNSVVKALEKSTN